ncbi:MAG: SpoIIE family protein phosphatase [Synergistaceae bacterium]|nr:SpoIIE family protein phosphatase [Synergistaceae bacterium]
MKKSRKRHPIQKKVLLTMLVISAAGLVLTSTVGIVSALRIRGDGAEALNHQMEQNLYYIVTSKATLADAVLTRYAGIIRDTAYFIQELYRESARYGPAEVLPPNGKNSGKFAMQRTLANRDVSLDSVRGEMALLGNLERLWKPFVPQSANIIATVYAGTQSGLMISYDPASFSPPEGETDAYYEFRAAPWYRMARAGAAAGERDRVYFTNVYQDVYGRGLTISCSAPFFDGEGEFVGVVCMDILITDLYRNVLALDLNLGEGSYAFLVDRTGSLIELSNEGITGMRNIYYDDKDIGYRIASRVLRDKTGVDATGRGSYYAYTPIRVTGWKLGIRVPEAFVLAPVRFMNQTVIETLFLFLCAFAVIGTLIFFVARSFSARLTEPIAALEKDVEEISGGNLDYRAEVYDNDEIGDLAIGFNNMAASLKGYIKTFAFVTAERERIGAELDIARKLQSDMLPKDFQPFTELKELDIYASMTPAKEVGGDFYDFFLIDGDHVALVIADVSGKGVPAALFMVTARTLIKSRAQMGGSPSEILEDVSAQLCEGNEAEFFVTVWLGILEIPTGKVVAANAGHEDPAVRHAGGHWELMRTRHSPAVAMAYGLTFREDVFELKPGDVLYLYTDGVTEAMDAARALYGTSRMLDALNLHGDETVESLLGSMKHEVDAFVGNTPQFDDLTMLAVRYYGKETAERVWELTVEARTANLPQVFAFLRRYLEEHGCPPRAQGQIKLAVEEIFVNIANYAYTLPGTGAPDTGPATIRLEIEDDTAIITFMDSGVPYDPLSAAEPDLSLPALERPIGGLGIHMVRNSMDSVEYEHRDGQNVLTMRKRFY